MRRLVGGVAAFLLLSVGYAVPASAADEVLVSNTGADFSRNLSQPLFDPALRWVPGDVRSATFFVKNNGDDPAALTLSVLDDEAGRLLESGALDLRVSSGRTRWSTDPTSAGRGRKSRTVLGRGGSLPVTVRVAFNPRAANPTQALTSELRIRIGLTQTGRYGVDPGTSPGDTTNGTDRDPRAATPGGLLPGTGAPAGLSWLLLLGSILLGTGFALVARRTHNDGDSHVH